MQLYLVAEDCHLSWTYRIQGKVFMTTVVKLGKML